MSKLENELGLRNLNIVKLTYGLKFLDNENGSQVKK